MKSSIVGILIGINLGLTISVMVYSWVYTSWTMAILINLLIILGGIVGRFIFSKW